MVKINKETKKQIIKLANSLVGSIVLSEEEEKEVVKESIFSLIPKIKMKGETFDFDRLKELVEKEKELNSIQNAMLDMQIDGEVSAYHLLQTIERLKRGMFKVAEVIRNLEHRPELREWIKTNNIIPYLKNVINETIGFNF